MKSPVFLLSALTLALPLPSIANSFWKTDLHENLTNIGNPWPGIGPNGETAGTVNLPYSRIPAMTITDDNKMVVMFDLRWKSANDQNRIDPGIAISEDGGHSWTKKTAWNFNESKHPLRRAMDPTILYNSIDGSLYVMHGTWSSGSKNWYADRNNYFNDNIWATSIHKSTDGGHTWEKVSEFSKLSNPEVFSKVQKRVERAGRKRISSTVGFLGGVGSGIVMKDGTLVFPIQTAHSDLGIATTIMYSKDNGKTWDMPETENALAPNPSSLENMVFEIGDKLVMTGREDNQAKTRWAYYTQDLGKTWEVYEPVDGFSSTNAAPSQGSSIYVTLPSGKRVLLVSKPNGNNDGYKRGNLALWMLDAKNPEHKHQITIFREGSGNAAGAGYSSLAYKEGALFVAFEDNGDITVKNLTEFMDAIEQKATEWGLEDEIALEVEKINALPHLNKGQKDELITKMRSANDNAMAISFVLNNEMEKLKTDSAESDRQAMTIKTALPSKIRAFKAKLEDINALTNVDSGEYASYLDLQALAAMRDDAFQALLNTQLDFSKYTKYAGKLNYYNTEILYHTYKDVFVEYDSMFKNSKYNPAIVLGLNAHIDDNLRAGIFFEHRQKEGKSTTVGTRAKYIKGNDTFSGFVRYREMKHQDFAQKNKNVDMYLNYARQLNINAQLSVNPFIGLYGSHSSKTLIDEDVALNKRFILGIDTGFDIDYKLTDVKVNLRPSIATLKDSTILSQSNYAANKHKVKSHSAVYGVSFGVEKTFNHLSIGSRLKLQKYGSQSSDVNFGINVAYDWR